MGIKHGIVRWVVIALIGAVVVGSMVYLKREEQKAGSNHWAELSAPVATTPSSQDTVSYDTPRKTPPEFVPHTVLPDIPEHPSDQQIAGARIFKTQLFPIDTGGTDAEADNAGVAEVLRNFRSMDQRDAYDALEQWLAGNSNSRWYPALKHELASYEYSRGYFNDARDSWNDLWDDLKGNRDINSLHLGNEVLAKLLDTTLGFAKAEQLRALVADAEGRVLNGSLEGRLVRAKEAVWLLEHVGAQNVMCGVLALNSIGDYKGQEYVRTYLNNISADYISTGLPLTELRTFAERDYGLDLVAVKRLDGSDPLPVPSVMHLAEEHYIAVLEASPDGSSYYVQDRTLGFDGWVDFAALNQASSGYFLAEKQSPGDYQLLADHEARNIFGRDGAHGSSDPGGNVTPDSPTTGGDGAGGGNGAGGADGDDGGTCGMPRYTFHPMPGAVRIEDIPLRYSAPVGASVYFKINYNDMDSSAPVSPPAFSNVGLTWSTDWMAWVEHVYGTPPGGSQLRVHVSGGGVETTTYDNSTGSYEPDKLSFATIIKTGTHTYTRSYPDGRTEIYDAPDNPATPTRVFLTERIDPQGNSISFAYDTNTRLTTVTDEIGQVTTLQYDHPTDIYKITSVMDPFGRTAVLEYNALGQLVSVTDQINLKSSFKYYADGFISKVITPYGTNHFEKLSELFTPTDSLRAIEVTDTKGDKERVVYQDQYGGVPIPSINPPPSSVTVGGVEVPFSAEEGYRLQFRNSYFWTKEAMKVAQGDHAVARNYRWYTDNNAQVTSVIEAVKDPLEERIWYNYPGALNANGLNPDHKLPEKKLRVLSDGTPQLTQTYYNHLGNITNSIDSLGRSTTYLYETNGVDLLEIRKTSNGIDELLASYTYNGQHLPLAAIDAAGQTTSYGYNARGQVLAITNALTQITTFSYDADGYLQGIDGALPGSSDLVGFTYDALGRVDTVTDTDGYLLDYDYDDFDRVTKITYPDGTYQSNSYDRLHRSSMRDRLGRMTYYDYDSQRQLIAVTDPAGRTTRYDWCVCGHLRSLIDPMGRKTFWKRDVQGRVQYKEYADGSRVGYEYDGSSGWLKHRTDEKGQVTSYAYNVDGSLASTAYSNALVATPSVNYLYDTNYLRTVQYVDGLGTNTMAYHPVGSLGANQMASVDGAWSNDVVSYTYDALGRVVERSIDGVPQTIGYDAAGRIYGVTNELGVFTYVYDGATTRLASSIHSGGLKTEYDYFPNLQDRRLKQIENLMPDGVTPLSKFDYTYDVHGRIQTWKQQVDSAIAQAKTWTMGYDDSDQLTSVVVEQPGESDVNYGWTYDDAGNRLTQTLDGATTNFYYNALNQLTDSTLDRPNSTYEWDAEQRLVAINQGTNRTEFAYDGMDRRRRIVEKENNTVVDEKTLLWCGLEECEERNGGGDIVSKRFYPQGFRDGLSGTNLFYMTDHLGSIRDVVDTSGALTERLDYDAWGKVNSIAGISILSFAFTGHGWHQPSDLHLAPYRTYDPAVGRWISRDPIQERDGFNLYAYVHNNPVSRIDKLGLLGSAANSVSSGEEGSSNDCNGGADNDDWNMLDWVRDKLREWVENERKKGNIPPRKPFNPNGREGYGGPGVRG